MIDGYDNRMISRERLTRVGRNGSKMIVDRWFDPRPEGPRAHACEPQPHARSAERGEDEGADAPSKGK